MLVRCPWGGRLRLAALALVAVALAPAAARGATVDDVAEARGHYERAQKMLERRDVEGRRQAIADLEQATLLDPGNADYQLTLARTYYAAGFLKSARKRFEKVTAIVPTDADSRYGLGQVWRRDWLKYLDPPSLARAIEHLSACGRLRPDHTDGWLLLVPLLVENGDLPGAATAARRALEADRQRPEALLAVAYVAYRQGLLEHADSAFVAAIPRLHRTVRAKFDDLAPVATEADTARYNQLAPAAQSEFARRFWQDLDPDLATPVNEALLEYRARVAHAYFLYYNPKRREWDQRGEVYARYGAPAKQIYNPVGLNLNYTRSAHGQFSFGSSFPANLLVWDYPALGMRVEMLDRTLNEIYSLPVAMDHDPDPLPDPDTLAARGDQLLTRSGRGVFPKLPPGVVPIEVEGAIARFEGDRAPQLLAGIEVAGTPGDSLWGEWVVMDTSRKEVWRGKRTLSASACDPTDRRVADFLAELPAGDYLLGFTVRGRGNRRGVLRGDVTVEPKVQALTLSDIVVSCGAPYVGASGGAVAVRPEPNPGARVGAREPLTAYFEIYHLSPDPDGLARFEYVYTVKSATRDKRTWLQRLIAPRREPPEMAATREEQQLGAMRRQFLSVPVQSLPAGEYTLEIKVRDLVTGREVVRTAEFEKGGATAG